MPPSVTAPPLLSSEPETAADDGLTFPQDQEEMLIKSPVSAEFPLTKDMGNRLDPTKSGNGTKDHARRSKLAAFGGSTAKLAKERHPLHGLARI